MMPISQFRTPTALVAELRRAVQYLENSIEHEEQRTFNFVARQFKERLDNLLLTISTLEDHLN
jgi:predicted translin family RNA/ssDNA-binding protein